MKTRPWERQKGESEQAFAAFAAYRDMGPERTVSAVVKKLEKSRSLLDRWKERWNWQERARAFDNDLQRQQYAKAVKDSRKMVERHIDIALQMQVKALQALKILEPAEIEPKVLIALIKEAANLERSSRADLQLAYGAAGEANGESIAEIIAAAWEVRKENGDG